MSDAQLPFDTAALEKARREVKIYRQKLERSEQNRAMLEEIKDRNQLLLKSVNAEVEEARQIIERQNLELVRLYSELEIEKQKSDDLLLNILPGTIAEELKETGLVEPVLFPSATVLFTDIKGFTKIAAAMAANELVGELNEIFTMFDAISARFGIEKIKTIGDSYMCAGGLPSPRPSHAVDTVLAGLAIQRAMAEMNAGRKREGLHPWEVRLGVHTGPVMAGVVGKRKFAYDIWGDTVNAASRMESSGEPGRVNASAATWELVRGFFSSEHRGRVMAKNIGEIDMYFINGILPELSVDGAGVEPSAAFFELAAKTFA